MSKLIVVNRRLGIPEGFSYLRIMRGSRLGNPFRIGTDGSRTDVIRKYRSWLWAQICQETPAYDMLCEILAMLRSGHDVALVCCCKPLPCHGDIIANAVKWMAAKGGS